MTEKILKVMYICNVNYSFQNEQMSSFNVIEKGNNTNDWENKTSGNKEPSWYANIEQPIKFTKLANNIER